VHLDIVHKQVRRSFDYAISTVYVEYFKDDSNIRLRNCGTTRNLSGLATPLPRFETVPPNCKSDYRWANSAYSAYLHRVFM